MPRKYLIALTLLALIVGSSVKAVYDPPLIPIPVVDKIRSMSLHYLAFNSQERAAYENDYRLFGTIKEAIEDTWKVRESRIKISNGLTFNSPRSTSGELETDEYDIFIIIQTKKRLGKLLYTFVCECSTAAGKSNRVTQFDLIEESRFYSEMKRLAIAAAKSCPRN